MGLHSHENTEEYCYEDLDYGENYGESAALMMERLYTHFYLLKYIVLCVLNRE